MDAKTARQDIEHVLRIEDLNLASMRSLRAIQDWLKSDTSDAVEVPHLLPNESLRIPPTTYDLIKHLHRQKAFSERTFGPGVRTRGLLDHISKEVTEVYKNPSDVTEWIDIVLLALDGAWRAGHTPEQIAAALEAKQSKNESRTWPDWRQSSPNQAIEHLEDNAHPMMGKVVRYGPGVTALFRVQSTNAQTSRRDRSKSYRLYGAHVLGGHASAHESDVTAATPADLAIWAEKKGLPIDLTINGQTVGADSHD
ncbi:dATP/dGTP pyrophosphohydrolase domain-containing protein [Marinobacter sp. DS40M6]|uniref:dATP/dGTP pyrophosphohydrolase domain-containing protein n=1 Tax=Marinobacter sp. DS40M6 TaxID=1597776 RepID=UPI002358BD25|nr:dATP/dGTP pyrophosphohydrolase domain-containing protein [Marinobacter sp. DS40M6]MDC8456904.1 DUF550 domain-containing protein [Marinobacter sp. DS40M6]